MQWKYDEADGRVIEAANPGASSPPTPPTPISGTIPGQQLRHPLQVGTDRPSSPATVLGHDF